MPQDPHRSLTGTLTLLYYIYARNRLRCSPTCRTGVPRLYAVRCGPHAAAAAANLFLYTYALHALREPCAAFTRMLQLPRKPPAQPDSVDSFALPEAAATPFDRQLPPSPLSARRKRHASWPFGYTRYGLLHALTLTSLSLRVRAHV